MTKKEIEKKNHRHMYFVFQAKNKICQFLPSKFCGFSFNLKDEWFVWKSEYFLVRNKLIRRFTPDVFIFLLL